MPAHPFGMGTVSGLVLMPPPTARAQASEQARVAAEVVSLLCSGNQLINYPALKGQVCCPDSSLDETVQAAWLTGG